ncbi:hypothetical protein [Halomonas halocynthiae]|uniref:hypothetical protein n=1 Tax=Halomonas halocynthiae TaxID=176290 RepID=UPI0003F6383F|nr:hypothetical protein [Halomonas halocynthiae]
MSNWSNPVLAIAQAATDHIGPVLAPIAGTIGTFIGMTVIVLAGIVVTNLMEKRHERTSH